MRRDDMALTLGILHHRNPNQQIEVWCTGPRCRHVRFMMLYEALQRFGRNTSLLQIAKRAACKECGRKGAHVQCVPLLFRGKQASRR